MKLVFDSIDEIIDFLKSQGYMVTKYTVAPMPNPITPTNPYSPFTVLKYTDIEI